MVSVTDEYCKSYVFLYTRRTVSLLALSSITSSRISAVTDTKIDCYYKVERGSLLPNISALVDALLNRLSTFS